MYDEDAAHVVQGKEQNPTLYDTTFYVQQRP